MKPNCILDTIAAGGVVVQRADRLVTAMTPESGLLISHKILMGANFLVARL